MDSRKILIVGDSFSAEWPDASTGWPNLLSNDFIVTNLSQAGVGEYKILKQLISTNFNEFDLVIVSHTSPSRIHTNNHPIQKTGFRKNCDLIYNDLSSQINFLNINLFVSKMFFEYHYDDEYQKDIYSLIREKINSLIKTEYISISHIKVANDLKVEKEHIDFSNIWETERGFINHYTEFGNQIVYKTLRDRIKNGNVR